MSIIYEYNPASRSKRIYIYPVNKMPLLRPTCTKTICEMVEHDTPYTKCIIYNTNASCISSNQSECLGHMPDQVMTIFYIILLTLSLTLFSFITFRDQYEYIQLPKGVQAGQTTMIGIIMANHNQQNLSSIFSATARCVYDATYNHM